MSLSLVVWIGGIIFFGVVAYLAFNVLPTHDLAGRIVGGSLTNLHWMGLISGIVYLICSLAYSRLADGFSHPIAARNVLIVLMLLLTLISLFAITPKMNALKADMGVIDDVSKTNARRVEFNNWHVWSTRMEGGVLLMGLVVVWLTSKNT